MPDQLKNSPDSKEFDKYLQTFMKRKLSEHRVKSFRQAISSLVSAVAL